MIVIVMALFLLNLLVHCVLRRLCLFYIERCRYIDIMMIYTRCLPINGMFSFNNLPFGVGFAGLNQVSAATGVQLQTVRSLPVARRTHLQIELSPRNSLQNIKRYFAVIHYFYDSQFLLFITTYIRHNVLKLFVENSAIQWIHKILMTFIVKLSV